MVQLIIQGLKPMYQQIAKNLDRNDEESFGALDAMARMVIMSSTHFQGLDPIEMLIEVEKDMNYVQGRMSPKMEMVHIHHVYDLIERKLKKDGENSNRG